MSKTEAIEIKSGAPEVVEAAVVDLLRLAQKSVIMSTGLYPEFYNRDRVHKVIENTARHVDSFEIVLDSYVDLEQLRDRLPWIFALSKEGRINMSKSNSTIPHWMLIDNKHLRLEEPHSPTEAGKSNLIVKYADDSKETKKSLEEVISQFGKFLENSTKVQ